MVFGATGYPFFIASFIQPATSTFLAGAVILGITHPILWAGQGGFITEMSETPEDRQRNVGIFWGIYQTSMLFGNLYLFLMWKGVTEIRSEQRMEAYGLFTASVLAGIVTFLILHVKKQAIVGHDKMLTTEETDKLKIQTQTKWERSVETF